MQELRTQWTVVAGGALIGLGTLVFDQVQGASAGGANPVPGLQEQEARMTPATTSTRARSNAPGAPGAGVPGVLSSARIAEKLICERIPNT